VTDQDFNFVCFDHTAKKSNSTEKDTDLQFLETVRFVLILCSQIQHFILSRQKISIKQAPAC
jgi:hypothetical protein